MNSYFDVRSMRTIESFVDDLEQMKKRYEVSGETGLVECDVLFKAIDLMKEKKHVQIYPQRLIAWHDPAGDPLGNFIITMDAKVLLRQNVGIISPLTVADIRFKFEKNKLMLVELEDDNEALKTLRGKISYIDYAAIRTIEQMCKTIKEYKENSLQTSSSML